MHSEVTMGTALREYPGVSADCGPPAPSKTALRASCLCIGRAANARSTLVVVCTKKYPRHHHSAITERHLVSALPFPLLPHPTSTLRRPNCRVFISAPVVCRCSLANSIDYSSLAACYPILVRILRQNLGLSHQQVIANHSARYRKKFQYRTEWSASVLSKLPNFSP